MSHILHKYQLHCFFKNQLNPYLGFLARILKKLAEKNIPCNVVSGQTFSLHAYTRNFTQFIWDVIASPLFSPSTVPYWILLLLNWDPKENSIYGMRNASIIIVDCLCVGRFQFFQDQFGSRQAARNLSWSC